MSEETSRGGLTYRSAGVDIQEADRAVSRFKALAAATRRPEVLADVGGFAGLFALQGGYRRPVLVSGTDGVGTKLRVAFALGRHDTVGIDLVAMCANDVAVTGAEVLFFLDYLAMGRLDADLAAEVVAGVAEGCRLAGCALLGGETAEMPGFYPPGEYELSGFCVGVVERDRILDGRACRAGDVLVGVASSGIHSNGLSLARKALLEKRGLSFETIVPELGRSLGEELLEPTKVYARLLHDLAVRGSISAASHITGGGLLDNPPRMLPENLAARFEWGSWPVPAIFSLISEAGVCLEEMRHTFNMGLGLVLCCPRDHVDRVLQVVGQAGERAWVVGEVVARQGDSRVEFL